MFRKGEFEMILFNVWVDGEHSKTTVIADGMNEALDIFCQRKGLNDHADYCAWHDLEESNINIEEVKQ